MTTAQEQNITITVQHATQTANGSPANATMVQNALISAMKAVFTPQQKKWIHSNMATIQMVIQNANSTAVQPIKSVLEAALGSI